MKIKILIIIFTFQSCIGFSQIKQMVIAKCDYTLTHKYDSTDLNKILVENYELLIGENSSVFYSKNRKLQDSLMKDIAKKTGVVAPQGNIRYNFEEIYTFFESKKMFTNSNPIIGNYIIERAFPELKWELHKDTSTINGIKSYKASTNYKGRSYNCWYTTEFPFKAGPWKLNGLPGLILKATDETNRIDFELKSFNNVVDNTKVIYWDEPLKLISWQEYLKLVYFLRDDPQGFLNFKYPGSSFSSSKSLKPSTRNILESPIYVNFKIEEMPYLIER
jgi:GLPGLI family protein